MGISRVPVLCLGSNAGYRESSRNPSQQRRPSMESLVLAKQVSLGMELPTTEATLGIRLELSSSLVGMPGPAAS